MNKYQKEYIHRINKVIDYIEQNLDSELSLERLADVALFSPYHFHRIFSAFMGETLSGFIRRKRIEKAASLLLNDKEMPELNLVYTRHVGAFDQIGMAYEKLMKWAGPRGLLSSPDAKTVTVYHDDPNVTEMDKVRQSASLVVNQEVKTEGEFGNMKVPGGKYVVGRFEILPTEFEQAWNSVCLWLSESGYQPADGYPYELYHQDFHEHPEGKFVLDICIPVKPM